MATKRRMNPNSLKNLKKFEAGKPSPNPDGRPKAPQEFRDLCKKYSTESAKVVFDIVNDPNVPAKTRIQGAELLINHGYGKPKESLDITSNDKSLVNYDISNLAEAAGIIITKVEE